MISMLTEIYCWIESRTGVSYDFNQELMEMSKDAIFFEPGEFKISYYQIRNELTECCFAIDEFRDQIPDDLPRYDELKRLFVGTVLSGITNIISGILDRLNIKELTFNSIGELDNTVNMLVSLCDMFRNNSIEDITNNMMFERLNGEYDNGLTDTFELVSSDITNMYYVYDSIVSDE